jgi:hypothetical protein
MPAGEQFFRRTRLDIPALNFASQCWDSKGRYNAACGYVF